MEKDYCDLVSFRLMFNDGFLRELKGNKGYSNKLKGLENKRILDMFREIEKDEKPIEKLRIEPNAFHNLINLNKRNITTENINYLCDNYCGKSGIIYFNQRLKKTTDNLNFIYLIKKDGIRLYCFCGKWSIRNDRNYLIGFADIKRDSNKKEIVDSIYTYSHFGLYKITKNEKLLEDMQCDIYNFQWSKERIIEFLDYCTLGCLDSSCYFDEKNQRIIDEFISFCGIKIYINSSKVLKKTNQILFALSSLIYAKTTEKDENIVRHFYATPWRRARDTFYRKSEQYYITRENRDNNGIILLEQINDQDNEEIIF